jgi:phosphatidylethanolamine-binding protein (PEBP) family uncharacterized protein
MIARFPANIHATGITPAPLIISDVPPEAESLVLIMDEPEPPNRASPIDHWVVSDIPPGEQYVPGGELVPGRTKLLG